MAVNGVGGNYNYVDNTKHGQTKRAEQNEETKAAEGTVAAEATKAEETAAAETTQKAETYKPDMEKINQMKADLKNNLAAFKKMVYAEVSGQAKASEKANGADDTLKELLNGVLGMTQEEAAASIADDGEWGVEATANRILDFAVALSGGDPEKIDLLRDAVQKGFDAAGKIWGGDLPDISNQTLARVMEGFDKWAETGSSAGIGSDKTGVTAVDEAAE